MATPWTRNQKLVLVGIIISIIALIIGFFGAKKAYEPRVNSPVSSPNSTSGNSVHIEGDVSLKNSVVSLPGTTVIGNVTIGTDQAGSSFLNFGEFNDNLSVFQNSSSTWKDTLFVTPNCEVGLIDELPPGKQVVVAKCSMYNSCEIFPEYKLGRKLSQENFGSKNVGYFLFENKILHQKVVTNCSTTISKTVTY